MGNTTSDSAGDTLIARQYPRSIGCFDEVPHQRDAGLILKHLAEVYECYLVCMNALRLRLTLLLLSIGMTFAAKAAAPYAQFWPREITLYSGDLATIRAFFFGDWRGHNVRLGATSDSVVFPQEIEAKNATFDVMAMKAGETKIYAFGYSPVISTITLTVLSPEISAISPPKGSTAGGHEVTIKGVGFSTNCMVWFDLIPATQVTLVDRETIVATTPEHSAGTSNVRLFCGAQEIVAERAFTFVGPRRRSVRR